MSIKCKDVNIEGKDSVKYLGVVINNDMSGSTMGMNVIKKNQFQVKVFV